jgi:hypothetical protein
MKIAFGIPFRVSVFDTALSLCLNSIMRYASFEFEVFILLDISREENFDFPKLYKINNKINYKTIKCKRGLHKQHLVEWISQHRPDIDFLFILHSDVFFYKFGVFEHLLTPLLTSNHIVSYWDVPCTLYQSTFHLNDSVKKNILIAPRCSSWFMCINMKNYIHLTNSCDFEYGLFEAVHENKFSFFDNSKRKYHNWIRSTYEFSKLETKPFEYFMDVSSFLKFQIDTGRVSGFSLGIESNPSFCSMELNYRPIGYVHIEQFSPDRYDNSFYSRELFLQRNEQIQRILNNEYGTKPN